MTAPTAPSAPVLTLQQKYDLKELLLKLTRNEGQIAQLKNQINELQLLHPPLRNEFQNAIGLALRELGLNPMEWAINFDTMSPVRNSTVSSPDVSKRVTEAEPIGTTVPLADVKVKGRRKKVTAAEAGSVVTPEIQ